MTSDDAQSLDGFVAAVKGETGEWNTFLIASYPANVYADAVSQTVSGFRPLLDSLPDNENSPPASDRRVLRVLLRSSLTAPLPADQGVHRHVQPHSDRGGDGRSRLQAATSGGD